LPRVGSRQDVWAFLLDHQSRRNTIGDGSRKSPLIRGAYRSEARVLEDSVWLHRKNTNERENGSVQNCTLPSADSSPLTAERQLIFRYGVLRTSDNICDFMSIYLSNSGQTTVINIAQKFIWLPCKFAFSRKWRPRYGPEPRNVRLANNR